MNDRLLEESLQAKLNHGKLWWHIRPESVLSPVFPPGSAAASVGVEGGPVSGLGCVRGTAACPAANRGPESGAGGRAVRYSGYILATVRNIAKQGLWVLMSRVIGK